MANNKVFQNIQPYQVYGHAGSSFSDQEFVKKTGKSRAKAGQQGEQMLFEKLRNHKNGWLPADAPLFCSLKVPGKQSDIDFAVIRGDKVLLIDAKIFRQVGGFFWNMGSARDFMNHNFGKYKNSRGEEMYLSKNMAMARDIVSKNMPGFKVESIVVCMTYPGKPVTNTMFFKYPGNIRVLSIKSAPRYIAKFFRGTKNTEKTLWGIKFLESHTQ